MRADSGGAEALQFEAQRALVALGGVWPRPEQRQPHNFHFSPKLQQTEADLALKAQPLDFLFVQKANLII